MSEQTPPVLIDTSMSAIKIRTTIYTIVDEKIVAEAFIGFDSPGFSEPVPESQIILTFQPGVQYFFAVVRRVE